MSKSIIFSLLFCCFTFLVKGQNIQLGNLPTTEVIEAGSFQIQWMSRISNELETPFHDYFKERPFNTNLRLNYGLGGGLQMGLGWESYRQTYSTFLKWNYLDENQDAPFGLTYYGSINYDTELSVDRFIYMKTADRLTYMHQIIISKWAKNLYFQLSPTFIRQNLVLEKTQKHAQYLLGIGAKYHITESVGIAADYAYHLNRNESTFYQDNYSISIDYLWNNSLFQLLYTNAQSANGSAYLVNAEGIGVIGLNCSFVF